MSWVAVAVGVVAAGASAFGASQQAEAADEANAANQAAAREQRQLEYRMFREGRGSGGYSILPLYAQGADGRPLEPQLLRDATGVYDATAGSVSPQAINSMRAIINAQRPAQQAAGEEVNRLFSGARGDEQVANMQPVYEARTNLAASRKNAALEALNSTLNEIKSIRGRQGFAGDSFNNQLLRANVRREANTQGATELGEARLANAMDTAGIRNRESDLRLQNLSLPYAIAQQGANLQTLPENIALDNQNRRLGGFQFFNIGTQTFRPTPLPQVQPVANTGQIVGQAVGQLAGSVGNYYANQQLANQYNQMGQPLQIYSSPSAAMGA